MNNNIYRKIPSNFHKYKVFQIDSGASQKIFYKLVSDNKKTFIIIDFNKDKKEYQNHIKIYNILKDINVSIPKIIEKNDENLLIITEDFGSLRYDKILDKYSIFDLLHYAVDTLVEIKRSTKYQKNYQLDQYNFTTFSKEIIELPDYYFPYIGLDKKNLKDEFLYIWTEAFKKINFNFDSFIHKDFNLNNLILIPSRKKHLKCGVIDFQSAFWGESSWDLFSLLEDSRILFSDKFNEEFIKHFFSNIYVNTSLSDFKLKFYFLNMSRQTRLLGRWIKLAKEKNKDLYLNFIPITKTRITKSINHINDNNLKNFYKKYIIN